jgi:hypothetical protein
MDILAPVFAYLTCVAGIIGAFLVAFSVMFSSPKQPTIAERSEPVATVSAAKPAAVADLKKPALRGATADNSVVNHAAAATQKREAAPQAATARATTGRATTGRAVAAQAAPSAGAPQKLAAGGQRAKVKITRAQWREIVQQERRRRLAYQQDADFESRFLGYAD